MVVLLQFYLGIGVDSMSAAQVLLFRALHSAETHSDVARKL